MYYRQEEYLRLGSNITADRLPSNSTDTTAFDRNVKHSGSVTTHIVPLAVRRAYRQIQLGRVRVPVSFVDIKECIFNCAAGC